MSCIRESELKNPIDLAEYLYRRLYQLGIRSVHGLPGDYNLVALDYLPKCGLNWVGNVNELNAGYAADGYARVKGVSALITTFGVGELSALNAIAGAYSEYVPIIHIVGTPSTMSQANGMLLHHTLGNGDFTVFSKMSSNISCVVENLTDPVTAANQIDHAIRECYIQSRPAYITLPTDMATKKLEGSRLDTPIDLKYPANDPEQEDYVVDVVLKHLSAAKNPVILVDACAIRHRALTETVALVKASGLPTFVAPMGKGALDETLPNFCGVYAGSGSQPEVRKLFDTSDLILSIGSIKSDFNTAGFSYRTSELSTIDFHSTYTRVKYSEYHNLRMNGVLTKITQRLSNTKINIPSFTKPPPAKSSDTNKDSTVITHDWFWPNLSCWTREKDIIITETGTAGYGIWEVDFKKDTAGISQILWGSIGYATGATQGAALAAKEQDNNRRTILFTGDGSFQLTAQEVSTMIRQQLDAILFIICNDGYTIERFIHGMEASYNDIGDWRYKDIPATFGAKNGAYKTYSVKTRDEVTALLNDSEFATGKGLRLVELYMPKDDAPVPLKMTAEAAAKNNAKQ